VRFGLRGAARSLLLGVATSLAALGCSGMTGATAPFVLKFEDLPAGPRHKVHVASIEVASDGNVIFREQFYASESGAL
jgi:hypothetical protein